MRQLFSVTGLVLSAALFVGCAAAASGDTVVKYSRGGSAITTDAENATYALYSSADTTPIVTHKLSAGDQVGFVEENGRLFAVAGSQRTPVETSFVNRGLRWKKLSAGE